LPDESSPLRKNILVSENQKLWSNLRVPRPPGGALRDRHDSLARDAMDAVVPQDVRRESVRSSRVVLSPRRWGQPPGQEPGGTVAIKPDTPGRARSSRNTIAQGVPDRFGQPVVTMLVCFFVLQTRLRVRPAPGIPCALCLEGRRSCKARTQNRAAGMSLVG